MTLRTTGAVPKRTREQRDAAWPREGDCHLCTAVSATALGVRGLRAFAEALAPHDTTVIRNAGALRKRRRPLQLQRGLVLHSQLLRGRAALDLGLSHPAVVRRVGVRRELAHFLAFRIEDRHEHGPAAPDESKEQGNPPSARHAIAECLGALLRLPPDEKIEVWSISLHLPRTLPRTGGAGEPPSRCTTLSGVCWREPSALLVVAAERCRAGAFDGTPGPQGFALLGFRQRWWSATVPSC